VGVTALTETVTELGVTLELELVNVRGWLGVMVKVPPALPVEESGAHDCRDAPGQADLRHRLL
jgi:hypothetical protein